VPSAAWDERPLPDESAQQGGAEGGAGMELKVELSLPNQPGRALDPAIASKTARGAATSNQTRSPPPPTPPLLPTATPHLHLLPRLQSRPFLHLRPSASPPFLPRQTTLTLAAALALARCG